MPSSLTVPQAISVPFANSGNKRVIPIPSQIGSIDGAASYTDGFPPLNSTPLEAGGVPPSGLDFNGILYDITSHLRYVNSGGQARFDESLATAIGGYPIGSILMDDDGKGLYVNVMDGNITNFNSSSAAIGVSWIPLQATIPSADAAGTADAITATFVPAITALTNGMLLSVRALGANTITAPTFSPAPGTIPAKIVVKGNNLSLVAGDIAGAGHWVALQYDNALDRWILLNPASPVTASGIQKFTVNGSFTVPGGVSTIWASGCAGGGGGGGAGGKNTATLGDSGGGGGGGGAGQSVMRQLITVQPGEIIPITIGGGGSKGLGAKTGIDSGTNGTAGGSTVIGSYITLSGGGAGTSSHLFTGGAGGDGGSGYPRGSYGGDGISASSAYGGAGASGPFGGGGGGGRSGSDNGAAGYNAAGYGAGGGGGGAPYQASGGYGGDGGNGSPGLVIIEW